MTLDIHADLFDEDLDGVVYRLDSAIRNRAHRKSSGALAELLHLWEVVNVVDETSARRG